MSRPEERDVVLEGRGLRVLSTGREVDFSVRGGEAVYLPGGGAGIGVVEGTMEGGVPWLDGCLGLAAASPGAFLWRGRPWTEFSPDEAAVARGTAGVVPAGGGLLMNLDMDENVWLPARHHGRAGAAADIESWARFFGCWPLPEVRAGGVTPEMRQRLAWTRAFAGHPSAVLLEEAAMGTGVAARKDLLEGCRRLLAGGCAVVWIAPELEDEVAVALRPREVKGWN